MPTHGVTGDGHTAEAVEKGRKFQAKAAHKVDKYATGGRDDRQHTPDMDKRAHEEADSPDAVWLHGTLKVHVRALCIHLLP